MSTKVKYDTSVGLGFIYHFLLMLNSNISEAKSAPLSYTRLQNLSDFDFDLSRSFKVKSDNAVGHPIYYFLLMFNSNIYGLTLLFYEI